MKIMFEKDDLQKAIFISLVLILPPVVLTVAWLATKPPSFNSPEQEAIYLREKLEKGDPEHWEKWEIELLENCEIDLFENSDHQKQLPSHPQVSP